MKMARHSRAEKLLIAAASLAAEGKETFTAEDLVVKAWLLFREDFSLKGYDDHPDSNLVLIQVMGTKAPLITRGWLEKVGAKQYRLTSKGLYDLQNLDRSEATPQIRIPRSLEESLGPLLISAAYDLWKDSRRDDITFYQFCRFVGLSAGDKWQKVLGRVEQVQYVVEQAANLGAAGETVRVHAGKRNYVLTPSDLIELRHMFVVLMERFRGEMDDWKRHASA